MHRNLSFEKIEEPFGVLRSDENATHMNMVVNDSSEKIKDAFFLFHRYLNTIRKPTTYSIEIALGFNPLDLGLQIDCLLS